MNTSINGLEIRAPMDAELRLSFRSQLQRLRLFLRASNAAVALLLGGLVSTALYKFLQHRFTAKTKQLEESSYAVVDEHSYLRQDCGPDTKVQSKFTKFRVIGRWTFRHRSTMSKTIIFPQIAGSYRGSYFSKVGLLITEIAAAPSLLLHLSPFICLPACWLPKSLPLLVSLLHLSPCMLITEIAAAPSLPSSFVSLHLSPCMLITEIAAAPSLPSSFVSLHADYRNRCRS